MDNQTSDTGNINSKWLENIYENLKKIEEFERYAREGCASILEYTSIPFEQRPMQIGDIQYKNFRLLINEFSLVIPDLTPVIEQEEIIKINSRLALIKDHIDKQHLFIVYVKDHNGKIINSKTTELFKFTLDYMSTVRSMVISSISHLLFLREKKDTKAVRLV